MGKTIKIHPSPEARKLYGRMVARSDKGEVMSLSNTISLSVALAQEGKDDSMISKHLTELEHAGWVRPDEEDGGWRLS